MQISPWGQTSKHFVVIMKHNEPVFIITQHLYFSATINKGRPYSHQQVGAAKKLSAPLVGADKKLSAPLVGADKKLSAPTLLYTYIGYTA